MKRTLHFLLTIVLAAIFLLPSMGIVASADPLPGGTLDPTAVPKFVIPLVIPPVMKNDGAANNYDIAVRQFKQQILPGGIWNQLNGRTDNYSPTQIWSYGPAGDSTPVVAPDPASQFNYPAYTIESTSGTQVNVRWINDLKDPLTGQFLPHLLPVDQTLHWANPPQQCADGSVSTDCAGTDPEHYKGPVPMSVHVHGSHVDPHSDGFPEAWWLPAATNIAGFSTEGRFYDDAAGHARGLNLGYADFSYRNDQPATTLWYHDHTLGMTRLNVYAGPAGFWLIRGGANDLPRPSNPNILPGPAPAAGQTVVDLNVDAAIRNTIREIPIVIQDRSFDHNGAKLFYPKKRAFFEGVASNELNIDFAPISDVAPTWQPEAFFNVIVVNGVSWPFLNVEPDLYRFRLLNGCNSRFLNLSLVAYDDDGAELGEVPFYQIGAEEGFLEKVVLIKTGEATPLPGNGTVPTPFATPEGQALLMGLAERADVIVDFSSLPAGTAKVRMLNTAPDEPFGGFPAPQADPGTTGLVMEFRLVSDTPAGEGSTSPLLLALPFEGALGDTTNPSPRLVSLNEEISGDLDPSKKVCVCGNPDDEFAIPIKQVACDANPVKNCPEGFQNIVTFGPTAAKLGTVDMTGQDPVGIPLMWTDMTGASQGVEVTLNNGTAVMVNVTETPAVNAIEEWEMFNFTEDAHPIHIHMVRFEVLGREVIGGGTSVAGSNDPLPTESGFKDTVIAYPGEITRVKARFDIAGPYVWHCHIVEHEDNEMMRPYVVTAP